jgi:hypothetical protein
MLSLSSKQASAYGDVISISMCECVFFMVSMFYMERGFMASRHYVCVFLCARVRIFHNIRSPRSRASKLLQVSPAQSFFLLGPFGTQGEIFVRSKTVYVFENGYFP